MTFTGLEIRGRIQAMPPEIEELHRNPPDEEKVFAEIGRTILAIQPTEALFNVIANIVVPDKAFTIENLAVLSPSKRAKTLGQLKAHLVQELKVPFEPNFLGALKKFIGDRNALVHQAGSIPGWDMRIPNGRIAAFVFLKNLQLQNIMLNQILLGLVLHYDRKHLFGVLGKVFEQNGLWPGAQFHEKLAKELFGMDPQKPWPS